MDFLSDCPSLVDILKLLSVVDSAKCKLVNRKIRDVLEFNRNTVKPTAKTILIRCEKEIRFNYLLLSVDAGVFRIAVVTDKLILLANCTDCNIFDFHGDEMSQSDAGTFEQHLIDSYRRITVYHRFYKNNSIEEGLHHLLNGVLGRCHFHSMELENEIPASWIKVIADTFKQNRSICRSIETQLSPDIRPLVETLGCSHFKLNSYHEFKTIDNMIEITGWNILSRLSLFSDRRFPHTRKSVISFLKDWQAGRFCMNRMILSVHAENSEGSWTDERIDDLLSNLDLAALRENAVKEEDTSMEIIIKRKFDNKSIQITVSDLKGQNYDRIVDFKEQ